MAMNKFMDLRLVTSMQILKFMKTSNRFYNQAVRNTTTSTLRRSKYLHSRAVTSLSVLKTIAFLRTAIFDGGLLLSTPNFLAPLPFEKGRWA